MRNPRSTETLALGAFLLTGLLVGCAATSRRTVLSVFFDGVPRTDGGARATAVPEPTRDGPAPTRRAVRRDHGPYAARLCDACHEAGATNALVAPRDELCSRCHALRMDTKYVHGPLASGGCLVCHDPHGSQFEYLLVSESAGFCVRCHDRSTVEKIAGHADPGDCITCHDAHGSDTAYLLK